MRATVENARVPTANDNAGETRVRRVLPLRNKEGRHHHWVPCDPCDVTSWFELVEHDRHLCGLPNL